MYSHVYQSKHSFSPHTVIIIVYISYVCHNKQRFAPYTQIPVAERSRTRVCGRSFFGIAGSNPAGHGCLSLVFVALCVVRPIPHTQESYRLWCVIVCDTETSRMTLPCLLCQRRRRRRRKKKLPI